MQENNVGEMRKLVAENIFIESGKIHYGWQRPLSKGVTSV